MTDPNRQPPLDPQLEELLRTYASTPQPDARFVARLEQELLDTPAVQPTTQPLPRSGLLALLSAWWQKSTRPRQKAASLLTTVAGIVLFIAAAALFISWLGGIQQIASAPTSPALGPISTARPASPTPVATGDPAFSISPTPPSASDFPFHQNAVYVSPADEGPIPHAEFTRLGIDILSTVDDLRARLRSEHVVAVYISPAAFPAFTNDDLQQLYDGGQIVIFLDIPVADVNARLPVFAASDEIPAEAYTGADQFIGALFQRSVGPDAPGGDWTTSVAYHVENFWHLVHDVERRLQEQANAIFTPTPIPGTFQPPAPTVDGTHTPVPSRTPFPPTLAPPSTSPTPTPWDGAAGPPPPAGSATPPLPEEIVPQALFDHLAAQGVAPQDVVVSAYQPLAHPDLCLGVYRQGESCTILSLSYNQYTVDYHVSSAGEFRQVSRFDTHRAASAALTWGSDDCSILILPTGDDSTPIQIGSCLFDAHAMGASVASGPVFTYPYPDPAAEAQWAAYRDGYSTFTAVTPHGFLAFHGLGDEQATEAEQQEIAAWLREVARELTAP